MVFGSSVNTCMRLKNPFKAETRELFIWNYDCWICDMNGWDSGHHILGRISSSPLNFCPIHNQKCHLGNGKLVTFEVRKKLLKKTYEYLKKSRYDFTSKDRSFIAKNKKYYKDIIVH